MPAEWNQYREETQIFKNELLPLERLEEVKKEFFDHYFTKRYFLQKKLKGDFYSQIMARAALNHIVWNSKSAMWAFRRLSKVRGQKKSAGGYSTSENEKESQA